VKAAVAGIDRVEAEVEAAKAQPRNSKKVLAAEKKKQLKSKGEKGRDLLNLFTAEPKEPEQQRWWVSNTQIHLSTNHICSFLQIVFARYSRQRRPSAECAIRMAKAGAHVVGINRHFNPFVSLECIKKMKAGLAVASCCSATTGEGPHQ